MDWGRERAYINHFYYFYLRDAEWGGAFWKTNAYAPYPIWVWLNGPEWAKRQLEKAGIPYDALDNGFRACRDATALQKIGDRLGAGAVHRFLGRWLRRLPAPFTEADVRAGYGYPMAFRQFEVSDTCVFDRPPAGRMWFESVIRDHLEVGRPDQIALIFHRRVITDDGLYAAGLRFGEQRVMAILAALVGFCFLIRGFTNRQLVHRVRDLLQAPIPPDRRPTTFGGSGVQG